MVLKHLGCFFFNGVLRFFFRVLLVFFRALWMVLGYCGWLLGVVFRAMRVVSGWVVVRTLWFGFRVGSYGWLL